MGAVRRVCTLRGSGISQPLVSRVYRAPPPHTHTSTHPPPCCATSSAAWGKGWHPRRYGAACARWFQNEKRCDAQYSLHAHPTPRYAHGTWTASRCPIYRRRTAVRKSFRTEATYWACLNGGGVRGGGGARRNFNNRKHTPDPRD
jgi:hypothetical protein